MAKYEKHVQGGLYDKDIFEEKTLVAKKEHCYIEKEFKNKPKTGKKIK